MGPHGLGVFSGMQPRGVREGMEPQDPSCPNSPILCVLDYLTSLYLNFFVYQKVSYRLSAVLPDAQVLWQFVAVSGTALK